MQNQNMDNKCQMWYNNREIAHNFVQYLNIKQNEKTG